MQILNRPVKSREEIDLLYWELEQHYERQFQESYEYFQENPEFMRCECSEQLAELWEMETLCAAREDFEKCIAIRDLRLNLERIYSEIFVTDKVTP
jgi:hypothetical protein